MWYFSWILGLSFALVFGILNAMWYELGEPDPTPEQDFHSEHEPHV